MEEGREEEGGGCKRDADKGRLREGASFVSPSSLVKLLSGELMQVDADADREETGARGGIEFDE